MKHKLLIRQIKMYLGGLENTPPQWEGFLNAVDDAYQTDDEDYALLEHTMDVSAEEIFEKSKKIEWLSRLPDESPHPVLLISKEGTALLQSGKPGVTAIIELGSRQAPAARMAKTGP